MAKARCYQCDAPATSREHVPPRNLFPELSDSGGIDYRRNLITVPSCEAHNSAKSHDDEFLMMSLAGILGNNSIGYAHRLGKVERAILGGSRRVLDQVLTRTEQIFRVEVTDSQFVDLIWGTADHTRLKRCFEHIAYGLHRHHFGKNFRGKIHVLLEYLAFKEHNARMVAKLVRGLADRDLAGKKKLGGNPGIFYYQVSDPDQFGLYMMRLCFYEGLFVDVSFTPETSDPPDSLVFSLIGKGVPTLISVGGDAYDFNTPEQTA